MELTHLPPGFRFHPTDVELVMYYLKRKVLKKKLHKAIADVNIYKFSPWDLPDKSCLRSKDLEWYFFCPREMKYASGARVKRATENGYWKTTGKDRPICYKDRTVGNVKTLVFHLGIAPKGERTDWVIHEYRILDDQVSAAGVQDAYVLCKVFKKPGPGPKNGTQYGAPFNEEEWSDDDDTQSHTVHVTSDVLPSTALLQPPGLALNNEGPSPSAGYTVSGVVVDATDDEMSRFFDVQVTSDLPPSTALLQPPGLPLTNEDPSPSAGYPANGVVVDEADDEIALLLEPFTDDPMLLSDENGIIGQGGINAGGKNKSVAYSAEHGIFNGLGDLHDSTPFNWGQHVNISEFERDGYLLNNMLVPDDQSYIELNDFMTPLDCSIAPAIGPPDKSGVGEKFETKYHDGNTNMHRGASCSYQQPAFFDEPAQMINNQYHEGSYAAFNLGSTQGELVHGVKFKGMERGTHRKIHSSRLLDPIPARTPPAAVHLAHFSNGSSMHIKAEVTHGAGERTENALLLMMEGSSSCVCHLPSAVSQEVLLGFWYQLLYLVDFHLLIVYCYFNMTLLSLQFSLCLYPFKVLSILCFNQIKQYYYQHVSVHCGLPG